MNPQLPLNEPQERRESELLRAELSVLARQWSAGALESSLARLRPVQEDLTARAVAELAQRFPEWRLPLPALLAAWRAWLQAEGYAAAELAGLEQMLGQARSSEPRLRQLLAEVSGLCEQVQAK